MRAEETSFLPMLCPPNPSCASPGVEGEKRCLAGGEEPGKWRRTGDRM